MIEGDNNGEVEQHQILIYSYNQVRVLQASEENLKLTFQDMKVKRVQQLLGYSSRIFLYKQPLSSFNKIQYYSPQATVQKIIVDLNRICLTYNNTQYCEEPEYNHQPQYSRPMSKDSIEVVVQICQNNFFMHQNYRVPTGTTIGFFPNVCARFARTLHVQYYNTRLPLSQFANDSLIQNTICRFIDHMNRLTITADSVPVQATRKYFQLIQQDCKIYIKSFFKLKVVDGHNIEGVYAISRKCKVEAIKYMLKIAYKQDMQILSTENKQIKEAWPADQVIIARLKKEQKKYVDVEPAIKNCQIVGSTGSMEHNNLQVYVIKESSILYRLGIDCNTMLCSPISICYLNCLPSLHLDQDLFLIRNQRLVGFAITINMVKVKYYSDQGELAFIKIFPWHHQLYQIQFSIVDLFCVRLKNNDRKKVRVFFIDDPENYLQVGPCAQFFPAKIGNNSYSDNSGLFAISNYWAQSIQIFSLKQKQRITEIRIQNFKGLTDAIFSDEQISERKIMLNFQNKQLSIFNVLKGQLLFNIICQKGMKNFLFIGDQLCCSMGSQIRFYQNNQNKVKSNQEKKWSEPLYIPEGSALIIREGKVLIKQKQLQIQKLNKFYFIQK